MISAPGVICLAVSVEAAGNQAAFVDAKALNLDEAATARRVPALSPDVAGILCLTQLAAAARTTATLIRGGVKPPVIMGGAQTTSFFDSLLADMPAVDILVPGEGGQPLVELLAALETGAPDALTCARS